jgi:hypothetical protein
MVLGQSNSGVRRPRALLRALMAERDRRVAADAQGLAHASSPGAPPHSPAAGWEISVKALRLIDGSSYGPEALKAIGQAFDEAWRSIATNFGDDPRDVQKARLKLASALLSIASNDSRDVQTLKNSALETMALAYRSRRAADPKRSK